MEWRVDNEDILLQVRASYNKRAGTLFVTSKRVAWYQSTARAPQLSLPLSVLKGAPRRNKTGEAHLLKFVLTAPIKSQADFNFVFEAAADRDGVQEVVAKLVVMAPIAQAPAAAAAAAPEPQPKQYESAASRHVREAEAAGGEARRRAAALAGDAELRTVHAELVGGGLVGEEEFWALRAAELEQQRAGVAAQQEAGPPSALVGDVRPVLVRPGELHYRLTAPMIRQIFAERPAVRRAYQDNVPHRRSEEEFWREYLQSRYVEAAGPRGARAASSATAGDIFALAESELEAERARQPAVRALLSTSVDVRTGEGEAEAADLDCEEPTTVAAGQTQAAAEALVARLNRHGMLVLEPAGAPEEAAPGGGEAVDLQLRTAPQPQLLHLHAPFRTRPGEAEPMDLREDEEAEAHPTVSAAEWAQFVERLRAASGGGEAELWRPFGFGQAAAAQQSAAAERAALAAAVAAAPEEALRAWSRAHELLRHYWGCFPVASPRAAAKARAMRDALAALRPQLTAEPLRSALGPPVEAALRHAARLERIQ